MVKGGPAAAAKYRAQHLEERSLVTFSSLAITAALGWRYGQAAAHSAEPTVGRTRRSACGQIAGSARLSLQRPPRIQGTYLAPGLGWWEGRVVVRSQASRVAAGGRTTDRQWHNSLQLDLLSVLLLLMSVASAIWALRIYDDNARFPQVPSDAYTADAAVYLRDAPTGVQANIDLDASNVFSELPQLQYKVDLKGPASLVGQRVLVSLVLTGTRAQVKDVYYMSADGEGIRYDQTHMRTMKFLRVRSGDDVTADDAEKDPTGFITEAVQARVVQKWVTITAATTATGMGDPGAADALFVTSSPGIVGDKAAGRYDVVLPQVGGNRDRETVQGSTMSRLVDNDGALYPENASVAIGSSPSNQSISISMAALPAGVQVVQANPERDFYLNDLRWNSNDADAPLAVRLEMIRTAAQAQAASWLFWAGVILGFALSALFIVIDRVAPTGLVQILPRRLRN